MNRGPWFYGAYATRDIPTNHMIFRERPMVVLPFVSLGQELLEGGEFLCVGCCSQQKGLSASTPRCPGCGAPLCAPACELTALHRPECLAMRSAGYRLGCYHVTWEEYLQAVSAFRFHAASAEIRSKVRQLVREEPMRIVEFDHFRRLRFVTRVMFGIDTISNETLKEAIICRFYYHEVYEIPETGLLACPVFFEASFLKHNCTPNVEIVNLGGSEIEICLRAVKNIPAGAELLVSRASIMKPTFIRQTGLVLRNIYCKCERCLDKTDMGLYLGSMCCDFCRQRGVMSLLVSMNPFIDDASWQCQLCRAIVPRGTVVDDYVEMGYITDSLQRDDSREGERFLRHQMFPNGRLHPSHYFILRIKIELCLRVYNVYTEDMQKLNKKIGFLREILQIMDCLQEGASYRRGEFLLELSNSLLQASILLKDSEAPFKIIDRLKEGESVLEEARPIVSINEKMERKIIRLKKKFREFKL